MVGLSAQPLDTTATPSRRVTTVEGGYLVGGIINAYFFSANSGPTISVSHGVQWQQRYTVSLGAGVQLWQDAVVLPLYIGARLRSGRRSLYDLRSGYALGFSPSETDVVDYNYKGGLYGYLGYGRRVYTTDAVEVAVKIGYNFQQVRLDYVPYEGSERVATSSNYHFFSLSADLTF